MSTSQHAIYMHGEMCRMRPCALPLECMLATPNNDAIYILEILTLEFAGICFILNTKKAEVLTTHVHVCFYHIVLHDGCISPIPNQKVCNLPTIETTEAI